MNNDLIVYIQNMSQTFVKPNSSQWIYVNFRIQLLFGHPNIQVLSIKKQNPVFHNNFENFLKIEGAIDVTNMDIPSIQSIKSSLKKDVVMKAGRIYRKFDHSSSQKQTKYRLILTKVAINQILPTFKEPYLSSQDFLINNPQYDSIYCTPRQQELSVFNHQYLVKQPIQYQWQYDVQYVYKQFIEWKADDFKCQNCKIRTACLYCLQDKQVYCQPCYADLHRSDKKIKHKKQPINPYNSPLRCQKSMHQQEQLSHYCFNCQELKCKICIADGLHKLEGMSSNAEHQVLETRQLINLLKQKQKQNFSQMKVKITALIRQIEGKVQLISSHYDLKLKQNVRLFQERSKIVRQEAIQQLNKATGLHCELKRKYDQIIWLQSYTNQLDTKCNAEVGMRAKEGINKYVNRAVSQQYFKLLDKKVQELKIFS